MAFTMPKFKTEIRFVAIFSRTVITPCHTNKITQNYLLITKIPPAPLTANDLHTDKCLNSKRLIMLLNIFWLSTKI